MLAGWVGYETDPELFFSYFEMATMCCHRANDLAEKQSSTTVKASEVAIVISRGCGLSRLVREAIKDNKESEGGWL